MHSVLLIRYRPLRYCMAHKNFNRLANESSLYLRQHGRNPVNWYPWGPEALNAALKSDRLLLISIGYSSCHWCHVMERESFENEAVSLIPASTAGRYTLTDLKPSVIRMKEDFDIFNGGTRGAPKFPMPVKMEFLMHYGYVTGDRKILDHIEFTLLKMAAGGIYDQAGGGFARYSVDEKWRVPHFEKMLYDNARLIGLYSDAFLLFRNDRFRDVVSQTAKFIAREMLTEEGLFAASIDADSEGEEGRFYVWTQAEIDSVTAIERDLFEKYYGLEAGSLWEGKYHVLTAPDDEAVFCHNTGAGYGHLEGLKANWRDMLLEARKTRERPVTDHKVITSWNAMAVTGLVRAWRATGEDHLLSLAVKVAEKILEIQYRGKGKLMRIFSDGKSRVGGFLDDYAFMAEAMISLYEATMSQRWLELAVQIADETTERFFDLDVNMFLYKSRGEEILITNHYETYDNVIPSSNSVMAMNLFRLGNITTDRGKIELALGMFDRIAAQVVKYPAGYSGWARLMLWNILPFYQVAIVGNDASVRLREVLANYLPAAVVASSSMPSELPLFENRYTEGRTLLYACINNSCMLPVESAAELISVLRPLRQGS